MQDDIFLQEGQYHDIVERRIKGHNEENNLNNDQNFDNLPPVL